MRRHVRSCWGEDVYHTVLNADTLEDAHAGVKEHIRNGSITLAFGQNKKGFSHQPHTKFETKWGDPNSLLALLMSSFDRAEIVRWVSESLHPFDIITDRGFQSLMKTGRPGYYLPHPTTVSRDVRLVFARTRKRVTMMLQVSLQINHWQFFDLPSCQGIWWWVELCDRRLDFPKPPGICCYNCPPGTGG